MANINAPFGLRYIGMAGGASPNAANSTRKNGVSSADTTAIYTGDLLARLATGFMAKWVPLTSVAKDILGVFAGCKYASASLSEKRFRKLWPGSDAVAGTIDADFIPADPMTEFVVQTDATGITAADIGANADIASGTGNNLNGFSGAFLNVATINPVTATLPLKIVDLWANRAPAGSPGTEAGAYNWAVVKLNVSALAGI